MRLIFLSGPLAGERYKIHDTASMGRDVSNDIMIPDQAVSLVHCRFSPENNSWFIKDLGSTNGITINGERIIRAELCDGDGLVIGNSKIRIEQPEYGAALPGKEKTEGILKPAEGYDSADKIPDAVRELSRDIFGKVTYYLKRKIADGGMGSVYEAEQFGAEGFIKNVAIKTILPEYVKKRSFVTSFIAEAKLVANLVHQNIVQIYQLGRHDHGYYIAMEYINGINLSALIRRHRCLEMPMNRILATFVASRICRGLEYAHAKTGENGEPLGLVHRDVSPNNIMVTREGEVKITDFGVAKAAEFMEEDHGSLVGNVEYMSPEQASCREVDARSDIYSLGLVYYELLTGRRVFKVRNDDIDEAVERAKEGKIPDPERYAPDLPQSIVTILMRCLEKDPESRYRSAGELGDALEREMRSKGSGPTIITLADYCRDIGALT
ncbi:MAG: protein kinase domain-containing protein [Verrucomicrobiota bacterium]